MTNTIDDLTDGLSHNDWKSLLAWAQILHKRAKTLETQAKKHLENELSAGDPENAMIGDAIAAEISITKGTSKPKLTVKDTDKFVEFLTQAGRTDALETVVTPREFAFHTGWLEALVEENAGELPPGVDFGRVSPPTVRVSLTRGILDQPLPFTPALSGLLQIEAPAAAAAPADSEDEEDPWAAN